MSRFYYRDSGDDHTHMVPVYNIHDTRTISSPLQPHPLARNEPPAHRCKHLLTAANMPTPPCTRIVPLHTHTRHTELTQDESPCQPPHTLPRHHTHTHTHQHPYSLPYPFPHPHPHPYPPTSLLMCARACRRSLQLRASIRSFRLARTNQVPIEYVRNATVYTAVLYCVHSFALLDAPQQHAAASHMR